MMVQGLFIRTLGVPGLLQKLRIQKSCRQDITFAAVISSCEKGQYLEAKRKSLKKGGSTSRVQENWQFQAVLRGRGYNSNVDWT